MAVKKGDNEIVDLLLKAGSKVTAKDIIGSTPLHWAAMAPSLEIVDLLIKNGAQAGQKNSKGATPLHTAASFGTVAVAERLIKKGAKVSTFAEGKVSPLDLAIYMGRKEMVELLIRKGSDINKKTEFGVTPVFSAALLKHSEIVKMLVDSRRFDFKANILAALELGDQRIATDLLSIAKEKIPGFSLGSRAASSQQGANPCVPSHVLSDNIQTLISLFGKQDCSICMEVCGEGSITRVDGTKVRVQKPPVLAACGHMFCKDCFQAVPPVPGDLFMKSCPNCRKHLWPHNVLDSSVLDPPNASE